jgi:hypothetical protein
MIFFGVEGMACLIADETGVEVASGVTLASAAARSLNNDRE